MVGATADHGLDLSALSGAVLAPGLGAQGATPADLAARFAGVRGVVLPAASRSVLAAGPPPAAMARSAEEAEALLGTVSERVAAAAQPLCVAHLGQPCAFDVVLDPSAAPYAALTGQGRVTVTLGGRVIADSTEAITLREASYPPVQYIPLADVDPDLVPAPGVATDQLELGIRDDGPRRALPDVAGGPLHDAIAHGRRL